MEYFYVGPDEIPERYHRLGPVLQPHTRHTQGRLDPSYNLILYTIYAPRVGWTYLIVITS